MATKLFPKSTAATATSTFTTTDTRLADFLQGTSAVNKLDNSVATLVTGANPQGTGTVAFLNRAAGSTLSAAGSIEADATVGAALFWVSVPINGVTISGSITANIRAAESAIQANYGVGVKLYRIHNNAVDAAFAQGSVVVELGTSEAANSITLTPTSTVFAAGDQIGVLIFFTSVGGTSASGRTGQVWWNGAAAATGDTFISFTETISKFVAKTGFGKENG